MPNGERWGEWTAADEIAWLRTLTVPLKLESRAAMQVKFMRPRSLVERLQVLRGALEFYRMRLRDGELGEWEESDLRRVLHEGERLLGSAA